MSLNRLSIVAGTIGPADENGRSLMSYKRQFQRFIEQTAGIRLFRALPRGVDVFSDIRATLKGYQPGTVFDVGANVGQSAEVFQKSFPTSTILCFEPVAESFARLEAHARPWPRVRCHHLAFSSREGAGTVMAKGTSEMNRLVASDGENSWEATQPTESVSVRTVDGFCTSEQIDRIGYLKIDTEGHDLEVLHGADSLLQQQRIDLIQVEAGMSPSNRYHVPFSALKEQLEQRDYFLFGIYRQINGWSRGEPNLNRCDLVFISRQVIDAYTTK